MKKKPAFNKLHALQSGITRQLLKEKIIYRA
jgi:hypothetical protein